MPSTLGAVGFNPCTYYLSFFWSKEGGMKNMKWSEAKNVYMLSGVLQMEYKWKALMIHQGPNQIPTAVVVAKTPKKGFSLFSTGTYPPSGCRYIGIVRIIHESRQKNWFILVLFTDKHCLFYFLPSSMQGNPVKWAIGYLWDDVKNMQSNVYFIFNRSF